ncbi:hypothetical protein ACP70R_036880 [Stipagrostis hirtigluma subsp. patula]
MYHGCLNSSVVKQLISAFDEKKLELLRMLGLQALEHIPIGMRHDRNLVCWILNRIDVNTMSLELGDGSRVGVVLDQPSVSRVLGVRSHGVPFQYGEKEVPEDVARRLRKYLGCDRIAGLPSLADAKRVLERKYDKEMTDDEKDSFLNLKKCNRATYILQVIASCATKVQRSVQKDEASTLIGGCWLFLENIPWSWVPRIRVYKKRKIFDLINLDKEAGKGAREVMFGKKKARVHQATDEFPKPNVHLHGKLPPVQPSQPSRSETATTKDMPDEPAVHSSTSSQETIYRKMAEEQHSMCTAELKKMAQQAHLLIDQFLEEACASVLNSKEEILKRIYARKAEQGQSNNRRGETGARGGIMLQTLQHQLPVWNQYCRFRQRTRAHRAVQRHLGRRLYKVERNRGTPVIREEQWETNMPQAVEEPFVVPVPERDGVANETGEATDFLGENSFADPRTEIHDNPHQRIKVPCGASGAISTDIRTRAFFELPAP